MKRCLKKTPCLAYVAVRLVLEITVDLLLHSLDAPPPLLIVSLEAGGGNHRCQVVGTAEMLTEGSHFEEKVATHLYPYKHCLKSPVRLCTTSIHH